MRKFHWVLFGLTMVLFFITFGIWSVEKRQSRQPSVSSSKNTIRSPSRKTGIIFIKQNGQWVKYPQPNPGVSTKLKYSDSWSVNGYVTEIDIPDKIVGVEFNKDTICQTNFYINSGILCGNGRFLVNTIAIFSVYRDFSTVEGRAESRYIGSLSDLQIGDLVTIYATQDVLKAGTGSADIAATQ